MRKSLLAKQLVYFTLKEKKILAMFSGKRFGGSHWARPTHAVCCPETYGANFKRSMMTTSIQEVSAGIIIYRKSKDGPRFLILFHGGRYWNFPKGKLTEGEKSFRAALREVWEETGISERDLRLKEWFRIQDRFVFTRDKQKVFKTVTYYLAETTKETVKLQEKDEEKEGERCFGYGWFTFQEAQRILVHRNLRGILKRARDVMLRGNKPSPHVRASVAVSASHAPKKEQK